MRLLEAYAKLAVNGDHILRELMDGHAPIQWRHYPDDDAIDVRSGYQWFYHCHSPIDRPGALEHGHFHLFARRKPWARRLRSKVEMEFAAMTGNPTRSSDTRHLLAIGLDSKGIPVSLFTVNSWVTGDLMLGAANTGKLLAAMKLETGHPVIDAVLESVIALFQREISDLAGARDRTLRNARGPDILADRSLEVLSETRIDLDRRLAELELASPDSRP